MKKVRVLRLFIVLLLVFAGFELHSFITTPIEIIENEIPVEAPARELLGIEELLVQYDSIVQSKIESTGIVGAAVVITYKNQIAFLKCYGVRKTGGNDSINVNTIFRLASVSKTMTGVLSGILSDENIIGLDDKIIDYLPGFRLKDSVNTNHLTIRNILSHTSGLIPHAYDLSLIHISEPTRRTPIS